MSALVDVQKVTRIDEDYRFVRRFGIEQPRAPSSHACYHFDLEGWAIGRDSRFARAEVLLDDSASPDQEVFNNLEGLEGAEWVRVSDDVPVDEDGRDRALESFEVSKQGGSIAENALEVSEDDFEEEDERPEPDPEPEE